jgi:hypothetical protein
MFPVQGLSFAKTGSRFTEAEVEVEVAQASSPE